MTPLQRKNPQDYWAAIQNNGYLRPNFWCAKEYWEKAHWSVWEIRGDSPNKGFGVLDEDGVLMLPLLSTDGEVLENGWCSLLYQKNAEGLPFLDWNYMYEPWNFNRMEGGKWACFRKNSAKWPIRNENYSWKDVGQDGGRGELDLFTKWSDNREKIEDGDLLIQYLLKGENRRFLYRENQLIAWLAWDKNYWATNFRWLITDPEEAFLEEYCRRYFFQNIAPPFGIVNDGGCLGNPGLEAFKNKLNPTEKIPIYGGIL